MEAQGGVSGRGGDRKRNQQENLQAIVVTSFQQTTP